MGVWSDTYNKKLFLGHDHGSAAYEADKAENRAKAKVAAERKANLEMQLYVPGAFRCAKCDFQQTSLSADACTGIVHPNRSASGPCPNCNVPMWPITWEEDAKNAWHYLNEEMKRTRQLEQQLHDAGIDPDPPEGEG